MPSPERPEILDSQPTPPEAGPGDGGETGRRDRPVPLARLGMVLSWLVIATLTVLVMLAQKFRPEPRQAVSTVQQASFELQARYVVGAAALFGQPVDQSLSAQVREWNFDSPWQAIRAAIVAGELIGPEAALERLQELAGEVESDARAESSVQMDDSEPEGESKLDGEADADLSLVPSLIRLYQSRKTGSDAEGESADSAEQPVVEQPAEQPTEQPAVEPLNERQRRRLRMELGWFGQLALAPPGSDQAQRQAVIGRAVTTVYLMLAIAAIGLLVSLLGSLLLVLFLIRFTGGHWPPLHFRAARQNGGVYAETFALWMLLFLVLSLVTRGALGAAAIIPVGLASAAGSLLALVWPRIRGVAWGTFLEDLGWTRGRGLGRELLAGIGTYAMMLPLIFVAATLTSLLVRLAGGQQFGERPPIHPVTEWLSGAGPWELILLFVLACVSAPVVEETVFRGLLYRHLRELTLPLRLGASVLVSSLVTGLVFAALHPQGVLGIPVITAIALALAVAREWRGTLVPAMVAHALNNGVAMLALVSLTRL